MTLSTCAYALRCLLIDPDLPMNDGFYRVLEVIAPPGTVVNARAPAAIGAGWETGGPRLGDGVPRVSAQALPERVTADSKGCLCNIAFGGVNPRTGDYFVFYETMAGGYGARATKDGIDAVQPHVQNTENAPVEETEANYPVRIVRYELVPDSEGAGRFRGGLGLRRDYTFEGDAFTVLAERAKFAPQGIRGGCPRRPAHYRPEPGDGAGASIRRSSRSSLDPGEVISVQMGGGGGYGRSARARPASCVLDDVLDGKISLARARAPTASWSTPSTSSHDGDDRRAKPAPGAENDERR